MEELSDFANSTDEKSKLQGKKENLRRKAAKFRQWFDKDMWLGNYNSTWFQAFIHRYTDRKNTNIKISVNE